MEPTRTWRPGEPTGPCRIRLAMMLCTAGHVHFSLMTDDRVPDQVRASIGPALQAGHDPVEVVAEVERTLVEQRARARTRHPTSRRLWLGEWTKGEGES